MWQNLQTIRQCPMRTKNCSVTTRWVHKQRCPRIIGISIWSLRWKDSFLVLCYRKKNISVFKFRRSEFWWILSKTSLNPLSCWSSFHSLGPSSGLGWETQHGKIQTIEPQRSYLPRTKMQRHHYNCCWSRKLDVWSCLKGHPNNRNR